VIEAAGDLAGELHVGHLVLAHRNPRRAVHQDVGRLQQRVAEEAVGRQVLVRQLVLLVLVGRYALEPAQRRAHRQREVKLGVLGQPRLQEQHRARRVDPGGEPVDHHLPDVLADNLGRIVVSGERMPIGHEEEAVVLGLQPDPVLQRAVVVAEVQRAGGAHAGEDAIGCHVGADCSSGVRGRPALRAPVRAACRCRVRA
jgi:hypothetical protein